MDDVIVLLACFVALIIFTLPLGSVKELERRNVAPTPSFRRRRVDASFNPVPISTVAPVSSPALLYVEDTEVSSHDADLRPRKRKSIDAGEGIPMAIDSSEDEIIVQETTIISIEDGIGAALEMRNLEELGVVAPLLHE